MLNGISTNAKGRLANLGINSIFKESYRINPHIPDGGADRPDLVNYLSRKIFEVKPYLSQANALPQLRRYLGLLNAYDPRGHKDWRPGGIADWPDMPSYIPIPGRGQTISLYNRGNGVILYSVTDDDEEGDESALALTLASSRVQEEEALNSTADTAEAADSAAVALTESEIAAEAASINATGTILTLVDFGTAASAAPELEEEVGEAVLLDAA